jgi:hypothetical protein
MTLVAALYLLENPLFTKTKYDKVFLIPRGYLENWILWAYHQPVPQEEMRRLQMGLRMAAEGYSLTIPKLNDAFNDPGPIDSSILSSKGNLLVLRDNVIVWDGADKPGKDNVYCSAVPERFYEVSYSECLLLAKAPYLPMLNLLCSNSFFDPCMVSYVKMARPFPFRGILAQS